MQVLFSVVCFLTVQTYLCLGNVLYGDDDESISILFDFWQ